jgi:hypothetical protein
VVEALVVKPVFSGALFIEIMIGMISVAEEQSATDLVNKECYPPLYVWLYRPECYHTLPPYALLITINYIHMHACLIEAYAVVSMSRMSHLQVPPGMQSQFCHLVPSEES